MNKSLKADILTELYFYSPEDDGRVNPIRYSTFGIRYGCWFVFENEVYDCFIILSKNMELRPGKKYKVSIVFLRPELIISHLNVGNSFQLREGRPIGTGTIVEILFN